jgi:uncharacterized protein (TIGR00296 family)
VVTDGEGAELVQLARKAVEKYVTESVVVKPEKELPRSGVFVTINHVVRNEEHLRGCIGFPMPYKELHQSVIEAAIAAAMDDPRFPPVDRKELDHLIFEVSVLTEPEEIKGSAQERRNQIRTGCDGLILRWKHGSGLLLPQVPVELGWDVDEYLANICGKAGAPADAWLDPQSKLYKFQAIVFKERSPKGPVERLQLAD